MGVPRVYLLFWLILIIYELVGCDASPAGTLLNESECVSVRRGTGETVDFCVRCIIR